MLYENKNKILNKKIKFNFYFVSLISPFIQNNLRLLNTYKNSKKKIIVKQSYIILTWFYYLSFINQYKNNKNRIKIFVFPINNKKFTNTKAPMAHKNWSKEQYAFKYYRFKINFSNSLQDDCTITNINKAIFFSLLNKKTLPNLETNLIFLKKIDLIYFFKDNTFFNYYFFNKIS